MNPFGREKGLRVLRNLAIYVSVIGLLWWALHNVPLVEVWKSIQELSVWQITALLAINAMVITLMTARWWIIIRTENRHVPFLPMVAYRLSAFGLSYFTPGPQVGGEPLQVVYLQKFHRLSYARATAAVIMDKLLEFLVNFLLLAVGGWAVYKVGLLQDSGNRSIASLIGLGILLAWPLVHILLLYHGRLPFSIILRAQTFIPTSSKGMRLVFVSERMAAAFCQRHLRALLAAVGVSLLSVAGILAEYMLMLEFLGMRLSTLQALASLTALQLAFLLPLPGGLGAMEASQVFTLGVFGQTTSAAIGLTLLQRARDLINGGLGLVLAGTAFRSDRRKKKS